jgi:hypothetical protein
VPIMASAVWILPEHKVMEHVWQPTFTTSAPKITDTAGDKPFWIAFEGLSARSRYYGQLLLHS